MTKQIMKNVTYDVSIQRASIKISSCGVSDPYLSG